MSKTTPSYLDPLPLPLRIPTPAPTIPDHPMKRFLDEGKLRIHKRDREFTLFLDLDTKYHHEFITNLNNHVYDRGYAWPDMLQQENELRSCAKSFVKRYGRLYWGSEENRRKYLMADSFDKSPEAMAVYPELKEEITRVIMILLEKKARNIRKGGRKSKKNSNRDSIFPSSPLPKPEPQSPSFTLYEGSSPKTPSIPITRETSDRQAKRKAYDMFETPPQVPVNNDVQVSGSNKSITPFRDIALLDEEPLPKKRLFESRSVSRTPVPVVHVIDVDDDMDMLEENALNTPGRSTVREEPQTISVASPADKENGNINGNIQPHPSDKTYAYKSSFPKKTTFLVSSNTQPSMGPVWIPFRDFTSASPFLSYMAAECHPENWGQSQSQSHSQSHSQMQGHSQSQGQSPSRQLNNEISRNWASPSSSQNIIAATVKLEWSSVVIRVRRGKDQDWVVVMRELQKGWAVASQQQKQSNPEPCTRDLNNGDEGEKEEGFKISVMLHIV